MEGERNREDRRKEKGRERERANTAEVYSLLYTDCERTCSSHFAASADFGAFGFICR